MSIGDRRGLSDELVEPLFDDSAVALAVDIYAMCGCRRLSALSVGSGGAAASDLAAPSLDSLSESSRIIDFPRFVTPVEHFL
jgi:hypothetical protein